MMQDYKNLRTNKGRVKSHSNRELLGNTLIVVGFLLIFVASGETEPGFSILWNLGFGLVGSMSTFLGLRILKVLSS